MGDWNRSRPDHSGDPRRPQRRLLPTPALQLLVHASHVFRGLYFPVETAFSRWDAELQQELIPSIHKYCRAAEAPSDSTLRTSGHRFTKEVESPDDQMHIDDCLVLGHILRPSHFLTVFLQNISFDTVYRRETCT